MVQAAKGLVVMGQGAMTLGKSKVVRNLADKTYVLIRKNKSLDGVKRLLEGAGLWAVGNEVAGYMGSLYDAAEVPDDWEGSLKSSIKGYLEKNHPTVSETIMSGVDQILADGSAAVEDTSAAASLRPMDAYDAVAHVASRLVNVYDTTARYQEVRQLCYAIKLVSNQPDSFWDNVSEVLTATKRGGSYP